VSSSKLKDLPNQTFIMLVKFAPGKGPDDLAEFFDKDVEAVLMSMGYNAPPGHTKRRHDPKLDVHELDSYLAWGEYDMVITWSAKDMAAAQAFARAWAGKTTFGTTNTLVVVARKIY